MTLGRPDVGKQVIARLAQSKNFKQQQKLTKPTKEIDISNSDFVAFVAFCSTKAAA